MFKEVESHFANLPKAEIRRSKFKRPHTVKTTANFGDLCPFYVDEILPGDTFKIDYSVLARMSTAIHPVMDNAYLDIFFFYVPFRILWENYEKMLGANDDPWTQETEYIVPQMKMYSWSSDLPVSSGSLMDYFGLSPETSVRAVQADGADPDATNTNLSNFMISAMPLRAYIKIWNDYFRDENLQSAEFEDKSDNSLEVDDLGFDPYSECLKVAKYHDYFTSCLPAPQKHSDVLIPITGSGDVKLAGEWAEGYREGGYSGYVPAGAKVVSSYDEGANKYNFGDTSVESVLGINPDNPGVLTDGSVDNGYLSADSFGAAIDPNGTLKVDFDSANVTVNQLRLAIQTQRLFERDARGGTRMTEILKSHFGVTSPDARLQRAEYLGGKRVSLNMDQIIQTSETSSTPLGQTAGWSLTADIDKGIIKSFVEPGLILGLFALRTDLTYSQGMEKMWFRKKRLDFYYPVLAHIGEQAVLNKEIYAGTTKDDEAFGYQEAWADYRYKPNKVTGKFRPDITGNLSSWTYTQKYTDTPKLGSQWLKQGKSEVDNTLAITSENHPQVLLDFYLNLECVRPMPTYSIPGLMDHF